MASKEAKKGGSSSLNRILIIQLVLMLGLSLFITMKISDSTQKNAIDHMGAITDERAHIIQNYVENSEKMLVNFSKNPIISKALQNPDDLDLMHQAQKYTDDFGGDIAYLEGLWIGTWDTHVFAHTSHVQIERENEETGEIEEIPLAERLQTRKDEAAQAALHDPMLNKKDNEVCDLGIIISPASGKQIISMYKAIYDDNHKPVGFVGLGIYTDGLLSTLNNIEIRGIEKSFYSMVNTESNAYIFNSDNKDLVGQPIEDGNKLLELSNELKESFDEVSDNYEYNKNGEKYVCIYSYIPKYNWILTIDDPKSEVYKLTTTMRMYLGVFGALILAMTIVFYFISKRQERINQKLVSTIAKNSQTKKSLNAAMFTDVLTNVSNRISFSMDLEKADDKKPYYFLMFNIKDFSGINTMFGNDAGDRLLIRTVEVLKENFPDYNIYRTGSDEFVVMIPTENGAPLAEAVIDNVNTAFRQLLVPEKTENQGTIYPKYKVAVCKKAGDIDTSVVTVLKDMTNRTGEATYGLIDYLDLTNQ